MIEGNLAELLDGTVCFGTGDPTRWVVCLTQDGRFRWSTLPRDLGRGIAGGPTVLPNGRVAILFSMGRIAYADPEADEPYYGSGGAPELGFLEIDDTRSSYSPAPSGCGGTYFVTYGSRLGHEPGEFVLEGSSLFLQDFPGGVGFAWTWRFLHASPFGRWGGTQGCTAVVTSPGFGEGTTTPYGHPSDALLFVEPDGTLEVVDTGVTVEGVRILDRTKVAYWSMQWIRADGSWVEDGVNWCVVDTSGGERRPSCARLEGLVPYASFLVAEDGDPIAFRDVGSDPSAGGSYLVGRWSTNGARKWAYEIDGCRVPYACLGYPVLGEGGAVLIASDEVDARWAHAVLRILDGDGTLIDRLDLEGFTVSEIVSPILAQDGTLYMVVSDYPAGTDGDSIIAIQTPVAGLAHDSPGWPVYNRRTARGDSWAP
jgi:hypothetical protein